MTNPLGPPTVLKIIHELPLMRPAKSLLFDLFETRTSNTPHIVFGPRGSGKTYGIGYYPLMAYWDFNQSGKGIVYVRDEPGPYYVIASNMAPTFKVTKFKLSDLQVILNGLRARIGVSLEPIRQVYLILDLENYDSTIQLDPLLSNTQLNFSLDQRNVKVIILTNRNPDKYGLAMNQQWAKGSQPTYRPSLHRIEYDVESLTQYCSDYLEMLMNSGSVSLKNPQQVQEDLCKIERWKPMSYLPPVFSAPMVKEAVDEVVKLNKPTSDALSSLRREATELTRYYRSRILGHVFPFKDCGDYLVTTTRMIVKELSNVAPNLFLHFRIGVNDMIPIVQAYRGAYNYLIVFLPIIPQLNFRAKERKSNFQKSNPKFNRFISELKNVVSRFQSQGGNNKTLIVVNYDSPIAKYVINELVYSSNISDISVIDLPEEYFAETFLRNSPRLGSELEESKPMFTSLAEFLFQVIDILSSSYGTP